MNDSILLTLKAEHHEIDILFSQVIAARDEVHKKEFYLYMKEKLWPHMVGEEQTLYAYLLQNVGEEEAEEVAQHAIAQHQEMKNIMAKLDNIGIESDEWDSMFRQLRSCFINHIEDEEESLFAEAKEDFSKEELSEFGDEFQEIKQHVQP